MNLYIIRKNNNKYKIKSDDITPASSDGLLHVKKLKGKQKREGNTNLEMEGADSYTIFKQSVVNEIRELRGLILMRTPDSLDTWQHTLQELGERVQEAEKKLSNLKLLVKGELQFVDQANKLKEIVEKQQEEIEYIQSHLPARLPGSKSEEQNGATSSSSIPSISSSIPSSIPSSISSSSSSSSISSITSSSSVSSSAKEEPKKVDSKKAGPLIPTIQYVTVSELESTPKYMKGRLTLDKLNAAIEEMQKLVQAKYKILSMPPGKMLDKTLKKYKAYKEAETNETKGIYFLSENDLLESVNLKQGDATGKCVIATLRHLRRIKDLGGATKKFAIVP